MKILRTQQIQAKRIRVGDLVRLENEQDVPCDIVLLVSSHKESKCFVTTANLDGETNLKVLEIKFKDNNLKQASFVIKIK